MTDGCTTTVAAAMPAAATSSRRWPTDKAVRLLPDDARGYCNRGLTRAYRLGDFAGAVADFTAVLHLDPPSAAVHNQRAAAHYPRGDRAAAIADHRAALALDPDDANACNSLAWLLATSPEDESRHGAGAIEHATRSCELTRWENPGFLDTLAAAHAESGRFDEAVRWRKPLCWCRRTSGPTMAAGWSCIAADRRIGGGDPAVPLAPVLRGEGPGVRGDVFCDSTAPPHPRPLSPEYRGEGRRVALMTTRLRLAVTADLHWGTARAATRPPGCSSPTCTADPPDVLVIAGDVGAGDEFGRCLDLFADLPCRKALVPGNHDIWVARPTTRAATRSPSTANTCRRSRRPRLPLTSTTARSSCPEPGLALVGSMNWYDYSWGAGRACAASSPTGRIGCAPSTSPAAGTTTPTSSAGRSTTPRFTAEAVAALREAPADRPGRGRPRHRRCRTTRRSTA